MKIVLFVCAGIYLFLSVFFAGATLYFLFYGEFLRALGCSIALFLSGAWAESKIKIIEKQH